MGSLDALCLIIDVTKDEDEDDSTKDKVSTKDKDCTEDKDVATKMKMWP